MTGGELKSKIFPIENGIQVKVKESVSSEGRDDKQVLGGTADVTKVGGVSIGCHCVEITR